MNFAKDKHREDRKTVCYVTDTVFLRKKKSSMIFRI